MHTPGAQVSKSVHPAAKMCMQGAPLISNTDRVCMTMYYVCMYVSYVCMTILYAYMCVCVLVCAFIINFNVRN